MRSIDVGSTGRVRQRLACQSSQPPNHLTSARRTSYHQSFSRALLICFLIDFLPLWEVIDFYWLGAVWKDLFKHAGAFGLPWFLFQGARSRNFLRPNSVLAFWEIGPAWNVLLAVIRLSSPTQIKTTKVHFAFRVLRQCRGFMWDVWELQKISDAFWNNQSLQHRAQPLRAHTTKLSLHTQINDNESDLDNLLVIFFSQTLEVNVCTLSPSLDSQRSHDHVWSSYRSLKSVWWLVLMACVKATLSVMWLRTMTGRRDSCQTQHHTNVNTSKPH